jgi:hypothetical protein
MAGGRWRQLGLEVGGGEGVDVVELRTRVVLLKVVARPEVLGRWWSMVTHAEEEGGVVNSLIRRQWPAARAPTRC